MGNPPYSFRARRRPRLVQKSALAWVNTPRFRALLVWGVLISGIGLLALNLFRLQVLQAHDLQSRAQEQQMMRLRPFTPRRPIVDRNGNVLALDRPVYELFAHPKLFSQPKEAVAEQLAVILDRPQADIVQMLRESDSGIRVAYALNEDTADRITNLRIDGLELLAYQQRLYPFQDVVAAIVGYVNGEQNGQAGIELSQQDVLQRTVEERQFRRMGNGSVMPDNIPGGFLNVDDLQLKLTIDTRLQRAIVPFLRNQVATYNAKRGVVIVMDVTDGSLLALVSEPTYDPNQFFKFPMETFKSWAITDIYEPGSTFKPINIAIALEAKAITPDSIISDPPSIGIGEWTIHGGGPGSSTVTEIITNSSNVGMVNIMGEMKPEVYYQWLKRLGLGDTVGIDLPSEAPGQFKDLKTFTESRIESAVTSFGQGFALTPIQLIRLHAAIANGGKLVTPHVVQGLFDSKGRAYWKPNLPAPKPVFSPKTTKAVLPMMESAVEDGTGKEAQVSGYRIAGKTGTSQKANGFGGYSESAYITSFIALLPAEAPRYAVLAVVDEPQGGNVYGGTVAAPIVKKVIETLTALEKIPPSAPPTASPEPDAE